MILVGVSLFLTGVVQVMIIAGIVSVYGFLLFVPADQINPKDHGRNKGLVGKRQDMPASFARIFRTSRQRSGSTVSAAPTFGS